MQTAQKDQSATAANATTLTTQSIDTAGQIMEMSETPEQKKAAFMTLFYAGTDETITKAVDYFYENPKLFSQTVKDLSGSVTHAAALKSFLQKISEPEARIRPAMQEHLNSAITKTTLSEYKTALQPYFALKDTFECVDRNRRSSRSCPSACDLLRTFNTVNEQITRQYVHLMYKKIGALDMEK